MKTVSKLSFIALAILLAGCNEKVSPELQQGNASTPTSPSTPVAPNEYYFAIENTSDTLLNYQLHKTGAGNRNAKCEVRSTTQLSNDIFRGNPAANDITCYFDAEELSLYHSGFNFKIKASQNTCDFVAYQPYGYYNRIPGDSSASYYQFTCSSDETTPSHLTTAAGNLGINITNSSGAQVFCNDWIIDDSIIPAGTRQRFIPTSDEELCRFNYRSGNNEQCDVGEIFVNDVQVNYTPATDTEPAILTQEVVPRRIQCGGSLANCVRGPTKKLRDDAVRFTEIIQTQLNKDFDIEYKNDGLTGTGNGIFEYANFRRNLANSRLEYVSSFDPGYKSIWSHPTYSRIFEPRLPDYFSSNKMFNNTNEIIPIDPSDATTMLEVEARKSNKWYAKPLAADPMLGLSAKVNPFYTFYCFDTAFDMKSRIRMVVRDWDRVFPNNTDLELLSDLYRGPSARMDNPEEVELVNDYDDFIMFNDLLDWDDIIPMDRSPALGFDPNATIWSPSPATGYPNGWFNPSIFPNVAPTE